MVVDDEKDIVSVVMMLLKNQGIEVHGFVDPEAALKHVTEGCTDCWLVLSDIRMPKMSGFELVREIRQVRPDMKIVFMTAFEINMNEFAKVLPSTKVDGFISKPFRANHLLETIKQYAPTRQLA